MDDLLNSLVVSKHLNKSFSMDDLKMFLTFYNLFPIKGGYRQRKTDSGKEAARGVMVYDIFKKIFFSHLHQSYNIVEIMKEADIPENCN